MITLLKYPKLNRVLLNVNPCTLTAESDSGATHYFRAAITVNQNETFEESWAKAGDTVAIDLRNFYKNRFPQRSPQYKLNGFQKITDALISLEVELKEFLLEDDSLIDSITFPVFKMLESVKPLGFNDLLRFQMLGNQPNMQTVHQQSKVSVCFFLNQETATTLRAFIVDEKDNVLIEKTINNATTGMFLLQLELSGLPLTERNYMKIEDANTNLGQIVLRYAAKRYYQATSLFYKNAHGVFGYADLFGEREDSYPHEREEYETNSNTRTTFEVITTQSLKINTGHLFADQLPLIKNIHESREVYLNVDGRYKFARLISKKSIGKIDRQYLYDTTIEFEIDEQMPVDNSDKFDVV